MLALSFLYFAAHGTSCFAASRILDGRTCRQCVFIIEIHLFLIGMTPEDKADYALLLAEAADKNGYSLLPCDSLLNLALHVYHEEAKEHAIALLYKGKVQQEMENYADALKSYRMALEILSAYP